MPLTLGDLSEVYEKVYSARPKWYNFGLALELPLATLDSIRIKYREDPSDCLREMLKARLKLENSLMWREIFRALRKPTVGESKLADQLEGVYDPQKPSSAEVTSNQSESLLAFSLFPTAGSQASAEGENVLFKILACSYISGWQGNRILFHLLRWHERVKLHYHSI